MLFARIMSLALLGSVSASALAADGWCSAGGKGYFSFDWTAKSRREANVGRITVTEPKSGQTVQQLDDVENYRGSSEAVDIKDFNHDGCPDLAIVGSVAGIGNESTSVYLYDPKRRKFVLHEGLSGIGGLELDPRDSNCVTGSWKGGAEDFSSSRSCWHKGKLVLESEASVSPLVDKDGELQCYQHVQTTYRAGRKKTKKDCTAQF